MQGNAVARSRTGDARSTLKDIAGGAAFVAVLIAAPFLVALAPTELDAVWDVALRWLAASAWLWVLALSGYLFWLTRTVLDIRKEQREILRLLKQRRGGEEK
jgi:hypothetical protein